MRKNLRLIALIGFTLIVLSGCGGTAPSEDPVVQTATPTTALVATPAPAASEPDDGTPTSSSVDTPATPTLRILATDSLRVRAGPGTDYAVLGALPFDAIAPVIGQALSGEQRWWQIGFEEALDGVGWVIDDPRYVAAQNVDSVAQVDGPAPATPTSTLTPTPTAEPVTPLATAEPAPSFEIIVDNRDSAFRTTGSWFIGHGGQEFGEDCAWAPRGVGNVGYVEPELPELGLYEIFAWWCGDPNHDQSTRAELMIYESRSGALPKTVRVNLQENAGSWQSLGRYRLQPGAFVSVSSVLDGNVIADAFRFVLLSDDVALVMPTPLPDLPIDTHNPPSPLEQLTSGDLSARLGLVQRFYPHTPLRSSQETSFDDCSAFPREGCSGTREGWRVQVVYQNDFAEYRVSQDYRLVAVDLPSALADRQTIYLNATIIGKGRVQVIRYPDDSWWILGDSLDRSRGQRPMNEGERSELNRLVARYGSVALNSDSAQIRLYGLGERVVVDGADNGALVALTDSFAEILP